ncbi:MAG: hypothetical protein RL215_2578 [Planctomycetota bacterium]
MGHGLVEPCFEKAGGFPKRLNESVLQVKAEPHQGVCKFIVGFLPALFAADELFGFEISELFGAIADGDKCFFGDFFHGDCSGGSAERLDQLSLLIGKRADLFLIAGQD